MQRLAQSFQLHSKTLARLSSDSRIISPEDDAAALSQASKLLNQSLRNKAAQQVLQNGISFLQTKDGLLHQVSKALDRMSELSVLALDATKTNGDCSIYNFGFQQLIKYINEIGGKEFNGRSLFYSDYNLVQPGSNISWSNAKAAAETAGGHLAVISNPGEQAFIENRLAGDFSV